MLSSSLLRRASLKRSNYTSRFRTLFVEIACWDFLTFSQATSRSHYLRWATAMKLSHASHPCGPKIRQSVFAITWHSTISILQQHSLSVETLPPQSTTPRRHYGAEMLFQTLSTELHWPLQG